jgi:hypothetical protein
VCSHGWRWIKHFELSREEEREHIGKAIRSFEQTLGERPLGWYCRYGPSVNTRELVVEEGGFLYDSDTYNDELPYWRTVKGKPHLVVPYSLTHNDGKFAAWISNSDQWFAFVRDAFDMLYREGARQPKMMSVGLHMRTYLLTGWLRGRVSTGNTSALVLSFLDADNKPVGEHRLQSLPAGSTDNWLEIVLADRAPADAAWVGFGVSASRQTGADWVEADDVQLRCAPLAADSP